MYIAITRNPSCEFFSTLDSCNSDDLSKDYILLIDNYEEESLQVFFFLRFCCIFLSRCYFFILLFKLFKSIYIFGMYKTVNNHYTNIFNIYKDWSNNSRWENIYKLYSYFGILLLSIFSFMDVYTFMYGHSPYWSAPFYTNQGYGGEPGGPGGGPPNNGPSKSSILGTEKRDREHWIPVDRISKEKPDKSRISTGGVPMENHARPDLNHMSYHHVFELKDAHQVGAWLPVYEFKSQVPFNERGLPLYGAIYESSSRRVCHFHCDSHNRWPGHYTNWNNQQVARASGVWSHNPPMYGDIAVGRWIYKPTTSGLKGMINANVTYPYRIDPDPSLMPIRNFLCYNERNAHIYGPLQPLWVPHHNQPQ